MDPRDNARLDDAVCGVCREPVSSDGTRLLARREDLSFVELQCSSCNSVTLGFVFADDRERLPEAYRRAGAAPVSRHDVRDMRRHLAGWRGDLRSLLDDHGASSDATPRGGAA
jgi:hypothetical protein